MKKQGKKLETVQCEKRIQNITSIIFSAHAFQNPAMLHRPVVRH